MKKDDLQLGVCGTTSTPVAFTVFGSEAEKGAKVWWSSAVGTLIGTGVDDDDGGEVW